MLRKLLTVGALVVVAVVLGAGNAQAHSGKSAPIGSNDRGQSFDGFSDGRLL